MHTAQPLRDRFSRLAPGTYLTSSHNNAYGHLRALVIAGKAKLVGLKLVPKGETIITVRVGGSGVRQNPRMEVGPEFFQAALRDYARWEEKWWREVVQNAVDAGATKVDLRADKQPDGTWLVSCEDNGGGMSEEVLTTKFLKMGGSTKQDDAGVAGGFGKAKEMLLLPWLSWRMHTRDKAAVGSGDDYKVESAPYLRGSKLTVRMSADKYTYGAMAKSFLAKCTLPDVAFTVDGEKVKSGVKGTRLIESLPGKFDAYFAPSDERSNYVYVRTKGLYMFEVYSETEIRGLATIELTGRSIDLLAANRDSFRDYEAKRALDKFMQKIGVDSTSAFRDKKGLIEKVYEGTGQFRARTREADVTNILGAIPSVDRRGQMTLPDADVKRVLDAMADFEQQEASSQKPMGSSLPSPELASMFLGETMHGSEQVAAVVKQLVWAPDFLLSNEIEGFRIPKKFKPETMAPSILKLAKVWTEFCRYVLMQLGSDKEYGVGFIFSKVVDAQCATRNGRVWLQLDPMRGRDGGIYKTSDERDLRTLYALAIHEVTHMANGIDWHGDSYAAALTHNTALCGDGFKKLKKIVGSIRMRGTVAADG